MRHSSASSDSTRILVLADTHNHLPERIKVLAEAADEIWHLGDVCAPSLLEAVQQMGPPVTVVRGNCDANFEWPVEVDLERNQLRFRLVHVPPARVPGNVDIVLHGHTHVPRDEIHRGIRFLNPGCVSRPNKGAPASVATMEIFTDRTLRWQILLLSQA